MAVSREERACVRRERENEDGVETSDDGAVSTHVYSARPGFRCEMGCRWLAQRKVAIYTHSVVNLICQNTERRKEHNLAFLDVYE